MVDQLKKQSLSMQAQVQRDVVKAAEKKKAERRQDEHTGGGRYRRSQRIGARGRGMGRDRMRRSAELEPQLWDPSASKP